MNKNKPPLGVMPFRESERRRIIELLGAILRYAEEGLHNTPGVGVWVEELSARIKTAIQYKEIK